VPGQLGKGLPLSSAWDATMEKVSKSKFTAAIVVHAAIRAQNYARFSPAKFFKVTIFRPCGAPSGPNFFIDNFNVL
jgi:hypothetical protein